MKRAPALALAALCAAPWAHATTVITATATSASSQPTTVPVLQNLINGDFLIHANTQATLPHVTGDGVDESTTWAFDFTSHPQYATFIADGGLAEARLTLTLNTAFFVGGVGPITDIAFPADANGGLFPGWTMPTFISGTHGSYSSGSLTTSLVAQVGMNPVELFGWLASHNGQFPMIYGDDAIVTAAELTLVSAPVPEPATWVLWGLGAAVLVRRSRAPAVQPFQEARQPHVGAGD